MNRPTTHEGWLALAAELRASSNRHIEAERESFERCDTDGCFSQFAHTLSSREDDAKAEICENDGLWWFRRLFEGEREVGAKLIDTKYGTCWILDEVEEARFGRKFIAPGTRMFRTDPVTHEITRSGFKPSRSIRTRHSINRTTTTR